MPGDFIWCHCSVSMRHDFSCFGSRNFPTWLPVQLTVSMAAPLIKSAGPSGSTHFPQQAMTCLCHTDVLGFCSLTCCHGSCCPLFPCLFPCCSLYTLIIKKKITLDFFSWLWKNNLHFVFNSFAFSPNVYPSECHTFASRGQSARYSQQQVLWSLFTPGQGFSSFCCRRRINLRSDSLGPIPTDSLMMLCILLINSWPDVWFANISPHSVGDIFTFSMVSIQAQQFFILWNPIDLFFHLSLVLLVSYLRNHCLIQGPKDLFLFSSKPSIVSALTFSFMINSEYYNIVQVSSSVSLLHVNI